MNTHVEIRPTHHYSMFETALGPMGIAWSEYGVTRLQLPEADRDATERRLRRTAATTGPHHPPPAIEQVIVSVQRYMAGENVSFDAVVLDLRDSEPFDRQVYDATRSIGWGQTTSYGELARQSDRLKRRARLGAPSGTIASPSSFRVIGCWRKATSFADSRRSAA